MEVAPAALFHKSKLPCFALNLVFVKNSDKLPIDLVKVSLLSLNRTKSPMGMGMGDITQFIVLS